MAKALSEAGIAPGCCCHEATYTETSFPRLVAGTPTPFLDMQTIFWGKWTLVGVSFSLKNVIFARRISTFQAKDHDYSNLKEKEQDRRQQSLHAETISPPVQQ